MKLNTLARSLALIGMGASLLGTSAMAQNQPAPEKKLERVEITGSSIKRIADEGALPLTVITASDLDKAGVSSAEQLIDMLNVNGNGMDNLASNADVASGVARGNNGVSAANLRGQGAAATLVLLNGRRVAAHGLNGGSVDLNQIPMAAIERVEVLKDGASAIYGTDAIGGVINFILKKDFRGVQASAFADVTEAGGGNIYRGSVLAGFGDLDKDRFNFMASLSMRSNKKLNGTERDFNNGFQADRGLAIDTRGTPTATVFPIGTAAQAGPTGASQNFLGANLAANTALVQPGVPGAQTGGINPLALPGQAGCASMDNAAKYDNVLWATTAANWACQWDTSRAAVLQQPVKDASVVMRGTFALAPDHLIVGEFIRGRTQANKSFSNYQISSSATVGADTFNVLWPSTGKNYDWVTSELIKVFPALAANVGKPLAFRWRCMDCGRRELETVSDTGRAMLGMEGSIGKWDYRAGISSAFSESKTTLGTGYFYTTELMNLIRNGVLNPFLKPGETQTQAAMDGLQAISAAGAELYGGSFKLTQADASVSGPLFKLPAGDVQAAFGVDLRREHFEFAGDPRPASQQRAIYLAPYDNVNTLPGGVTRTIKAAYTEVLVPITKQLEANVAVRRDHYNDFGATVNPKYSLRYAPMKEVVVRGSYNTGFRAPTFAQQYFPITSSFVSSSQIPDPAKCPSGVISGATGCTAQSYSLWSGGRSDIKPEEAKQWTYGIVLSPTPNLVASIDYWHINRINAIQTVPVSTMATNYETYKQFFLYAPDGTMIVDQRWVNAGETVTDGLEFSGRWTATTEGIKFTLGADVSYLLKKKSRVAGAAAFGASEIGRFNRGGDVGVRWKHTAFVTMASGDWSTTLTQVYRGAYADAQLPGVANGSVKPANWTATVEPYRLHHISVTYKGFKNLSITGGVKNFVDQDPPFSASYDTNTGAGGLWEPRIADPRGRSFTLAATYTFF